MASNHQDDHPAKHLGTCDALDELVEMAQTKVPKAPGFVQPTRPEVLPDRNRA